MTQPGSGQSTSPDGPDPALVDWLSARVQAEVVALQEAEADAQAFTQAVLMRLPPRPAEVRAVQAPPPREPVLSRAAQSLLALGLLVAVLALAGVVMQLWPPAASTTWSPAGELGSLLALWTWLGLLTWWTRSLWGDWGLGAMAREVLRGAA